MEEQLKQFVENIFSKAPCTSQAVALKEQTMADVTARFRRFVNDGENEQTAYNMAVASIGDVNELLKSVCPEQTNNNYGYTQQTAQPQYNYNPASEEDMHKDKVRNAVLLAVAVMLYILCPVPCIIFQNVAGVILLFVMVAVATGLIIFRATTKRTYHQPESFQQTSQTYGFNERKKSLFKAISSALWAVILVLYFVVSFATSAWYITWVIFLIGGAAEGIVKAVIEIVD